jgi:alpha-glucosidase
MIKIFLLVLLICLPISIYCTYDLINITETTIGYLGYLQLNPETETTLYGNDILHLTFELIFETCDIIRVKLTDTYKTRWEIPQSIISRPQRLLKPEVSNLAFNYESSPFTFTVTRILDGVVLFKLDPNEIIYKDQYLKIQTFSDPTAVTYGLGESTRLEQTLKTNTTYTLWAMDLAASSFYHNLYGSFPYYMQIVDGKAHGVMLFNSNGMDVILQDEYLAFQVIGGVIDLYIFGGHSPTEVVQQLTSIVGRPALVPYWSLGLSSEIIVKTLK